MPKSKELVVLKTKDMGEPTYFIGGVYHGHHGWTNKNKESTTCYTYVLVYVKTKDGDHLGYKTRVLHEHVGESVPPEHAGTFEEQVLVDYPEVDALLCKAAMALVKQGVNPDSKVMATIFKNKMQYMKKKLDKKVGKKTRKNRLPKI